MLSRIFTCQLSRALLVVLVLISYGSLYPWEFHSARWPSDPLFVLGQSWYWPTNSFLRWDAFLNVALYFPVGVLGHIALRRAGWHWPSLTVPIALGLALSTSVEVVQMVFTLRHANVTDIATNTAGCITGVVVASTLLRSLTLVPGEGWPVVAGFLVYLFFPFVPVLDPSGLETKLALFVAGPALAAILPAITAAAVWFTAGLAFRATGLRKASGLLAWTLLAVPAQILLAGRWPHVGELLGAAFGWLLFSRVGRLRQASVAAAIGWTGLLAVRGLVPFNFGPALHPFGLLPFQAVLAAPWNQAIFTLIDKTFFTLLTIWTIRFAGGTWKSASLITAAVLMITELLQIRLPGRTPDSTDPAIALLIGLIGGPSKPASTAGRRPDEHLPSPVVGGTVNR